MQVEPIESRNIRLRTARPEDSGFMIALRSDPSFARHLGTLAPDLERQVAWINAKVSAVDDLPMIIEDRRTGAGIGSVSISRISIPLKYCHWGRWIIGPGHAVTAAMESALLVYALAFDRLGLELAVFEVGNENAKVLSFHEKLGAHFMYRGSSDSWYFFTKDDFTAAKTRYARFL